MDLERASDAQLVEAFQRGNREGAFSVIYGRYRDLVQRVCVANAATPEHAEDAEQETFLALHRRLESFDGGQRLGHYLTRTAKLTSQDRRGYARRTREIPSESVGRAPDPCSQVDAVLNSVVLARVLDDLPMNQRQALIGRHSLGMARAEIAEVLDTTEGYVAILLHRGSRLAREMTALVHGVAILGFIRFRRLAAWGQGQDAVGASVPALIMAATLVLAPVGGAVAGDSASTSDSVVASLARERVMDAALDRGPDISLPPGSTPSEPSTAIDAPVADAVADERSGQQPSGLVPETSIPATDHGVGDQWTEDPDYRYDVTVAEVTVAELDVDDEPEQEAAHDTSCDLLGPGEVAGCSRSTGVDG